MILVLPTFSTANFFLAAPGQTEVSCSQCWKLYYTQNINFGSFSVEPFSTFSVKADQSHCSTTSGASWRLCGASSQYKWKWWAELFFFFCCSLNEEMSRCDQNDQTVHTPVQPLTRTQLPSLKGGCIHGLWWTMGSGRRASVSITSQMEKSHNVVIYELLPRKTFTFSRRIGPQWCCAAWSPLFHQTVNVNFELLYAEFKLLSMKMSSLSFFCFVFPTPHHDMIQPLQWRLSIAKHIVV